MGSERDIPKKLVRYKMTSGRILDSKFCPNCNAAIPDDCKIRNYCHCCGQRILKEWEWALQ